MRPRRSLLALALLASPAVAQTTWYVDGANTPPGTGTQADPYTSIQYAIAQASTLPGDTVLVQPGTYQERIDFLGKAIHVKSSSGSAATTLDNSTIGGDLVTFATGEGPSAILEGFSLVRTSFLLLGRGIVASHASPTVRDCVVRGQYGGVYLDHSNALLDRCTFDGNGACPAGGGVYAVDSSPTILDSEFTDNDSQAGSGLAVLRSDVDVFRCTFVSNGSVFCATGGPGAAAYLDESTALFVDCVMDDNRAGFGGGGLYVQSSQAHLVRCTITNGCADGGGGILSRFNSTLTIIDSSIVGNSATFLHGGGIWAENSDVEVYRTTISDNRAPLEQHSGGGIYQSGGSLLMEDCLVDSNFASCLGGGIYLDAPATIRNSTITNNTVNVDGIFCAPQGGGLWCASSAVVERCLIAGNEVYPYDCYGMFLSGIPDYGFGGGVAGPAQLVNCVLYGNTAFGDAGGAFGATLLNTIVLDNRLGDCDTVGAIDNLLGCTVTYSNVQGGAPGTGNIDLPPRFWGPPIEDFHLLPGSPCIDAGDPASPLDPDGSRADMGIYPFDPNYCGSSFNYCTGKTNSLGCVPFLTTNGFPSATSTGPFEIIGNDMVPSEAGFMVYGFNRNQLGFHGGTLCVKAPVARVLPPQHSKATGTPPCTGRLLFGFNKRIQSGVDVLLVPGQTVFVQVRQRDPNDPAGFGDSLTDAVQFTICP